MGKKGLLKIILPNSNKKIKIEARVNSGIKRAACEPDPEKSIEIILEFLGNELDGERTYIFEKNSRGGDDNTYEWTAVGITSEKENLQNLPPQVCENWYNYFGEDKNIIFDDIEKMLPDYPLQYQKLKSQDIHSIIVVPLYNDDSVIGFYGIDNPPKRNMKRTLKMLRAVGDFIGSMIKQRDMMNKLCEISRCDHLTGLGNRYALDDLVSNIGSERSMGVVYCDITGLKRTNDTMGHKAGDELICRASESLKSAFGEYGLIRLGGDELLAVCADIDEDTLKKRIDLLRKNSVENSVNLAIGAVWNNNYRNDLQGLIDEAETLMYKEKDNYYRKTGIDRRR